MIASRSARRIAYFLFCHSKAVNQQKSNNAANAVNMLSVDSLVIWASNRKNQNVVIKSDMQNPYEILEKAIWKIQLRLFDSNVHIPRWCSFVFKGSNDSILNNCIILYSDNELKRSESPQSTIYFFLLEETVLLWWSYQTLFGYANPFIVVSILTIISRLLTHITFVIISAHVQESQRGDMVSRAIKLFR